MIIGAHQKTLSARLLLLVSVIAFINAGCVSSDRDTRDSPPQTDTRPEGSWKLVTLDGIDILSNPWSDRGTPSIKFSEKGASGFAGVNRYSGSWDPDGFLGPIASTKMAGPGWAMRIESLFLDILSSSDGARVTSDEMIILVGSSERAVLVRE